MVGVRVSVLVTVGVISGVPDGVGDAGTEAVLETLVVGVGDLGIVREFVGVGVLLNPGLDAGVAETDRDGVALELLVIVRVQVLVLVGVLVGVQVLVPDLVGVGDFGGVFDAVELLVNERVGVDVVFAVRLFVGDGVLELPGDTNGVFDGEIICGENNGVSVTIK